PIAPVLITIYVCIGTLQHANLRWTYGPAGRVIVSPAYHRLHHAREDQSINLGVVLTIWDVLAGRARFPSRSAAAGRTGLDGRARAVRRPGGPACPPPRSRRRTTTRPRQARRSAPGSSASHSRLNADRRAPQASAA